jgi:hypothetical protein
LFAVNALASLLFLLSLLVQFLLHVIISSMDKKSILVGWDRLA